MAKKTVETTATEEVKTTAAKTRKTATRKTVSPEVFVQYWGREVAAADVVAAVKKVWTGEMKKKVSELKDLKVYIKPEDNGAHYVINGEITGFINL